MYRLPAGGGRECPGRGRLDRARAARALAPDGYILGTSANTLQAIAPHLGKLPYDTVKSFTPIGTLAGFAFVLIVGPNTQIVSLADLIAKAKHHPGKISAASAGLGTGIHMAAVLLSQSTGAVFNIVQYKGSGAALGDLIGGHVDFTFEVIGSAMPHISSGKTKVIATTGARRHPLLPNVPLVAESIPGLEFVGWFALFGPAGLPPDVTRRLNEELGRIHRSEEFRNYLETRGYEILPGSSGDLAERIQRELAKWGEVVKKIPEAALRQ